MSVISSRDPANATAASIPLTRPGSRSSDSRPIFLLERCLAIRFERILSAALPVVQPHAKKSAAESSRPASSLSQLSSWLPWQRHSNANTAPPSVAPSLERSDAQPSIHPIAPSIVKDISAPAGWVYDGGFVLYQVGFVLKWKSFIVVSGPSLLASINWKWTRIDDKKPCPSMDSLSIWILFLRKCCYMSTKANDEMSVSRDSLRQ